MEPRARASRHKGQLNFPQDLKLLLQAFGAPGDPSQPSQVEPYPETLRVLDELLTDFIIETCHAAVAVANYSGRQKLKTEDFTFVLRKDQAKLGHVQTMFEKKREIDEKKRGFDASAMGEGAKIAVEDLTTLAEEVGEEGTGKGKGRGRGRKRKEKDRDEDKSVVGTEGGGKKARSDG